MYKKKNLDKLKTEQKENTRLVNKMQWMEIGEKLSTRLLVLASPSHNYGKYFHGNKNGRFTPR